MNTLPKYARRYYDNYLNYVCSVNKIKKKDFLAKIDGGTCRDFKKYLLLMRKGHSRSMINFIAMLDNEIGMVTCYNAGLHFCIKDIPDSVDYNAFKDLAVSTDIFIDFRYAGKDCFMHVWPRNYPIVLDGKRYDYQISVYVDDPAMHSYNKDALSGQYGNLWEFMQTYKLHIDMSGTEHLMEVHDGNKYITNKYRTVDILSDRGEHAFVPLDEDGLCEELAFVDPDTVLNIVNHVLYCYKNRRSLNRKNGVAHKSYSKCKVHTASKDSSSTDVYVPLTSYVQTERKVCPYKGGHHKSPIEHDRRGFFRKSRGRGDYDLVDGEFVYIGDKQGAYSKVPPSHVGGNKKKNVTIYKV